MGPGNRFGTSKGVSRMQGRSYKCEKCSGHILLAYSGWSCIQCGRNYFLRDGRIEEMWWKNQTVKYQTPQPVAAR